MSILGINPIMISRSEQNYRLDPNDTFLNPQSTNDSVFFQSFKNSLVNSSIPYLSSKVSDFQDWLDPIPPEDLVTPELAKEKYGLDIKESMPDYKVNHILANKNFDIISNRAIERRKRQNSRGGSWDLTNWLENAGGILAGAFLDPTLIASSLIPGAALASLSQKSAKIASVIYSSNKLVKYGSRAGLIGTVDGAVNVFYDKSLKHGQGKDDYSLLEGAQSFAVGLIVGGLTSSLGFKKRIKVFDVVKESDSKAFIIVPQKYEPNFKIVGSPRNKFYAPVLVPDVKLLGLKAPPPAVYQYNLPAVVKKKIGANESIFINKKGVNEVMFIDDLTLLKEYERFYTLGKSAIVGELNLSSDIMNYMSIYSQKLIQNHGVLEGFLNVGDGFNKAIINYHKNVWKKYNGVQISPASILQKDMQKISDDIANREILRSKKGSSFEEVANLDEGIIKNRIYDFRMEKLKKSKKDNFSLFNNVTLSNQDILTRVNLTPVKPVSLTGKPLNNNVVSRQVVEHAFKNAPVVPKAKLFHNSLKELKLSFNSKDLIDNPKFYKFRTLNSLKNIEKAYKSYKASVSLKRSSSLANLSLVISRKKYNSTLAKLSMLPSIKNNKVLINLIKSKIDIVNEDDLIEVMEEWSRGYYK